MKSQVRERLRGKEKRRKIKIAQRQNCRKSSHAQRAVSGFVRGGQDRQEREEAGSGKRAQGEAPGLQIEPFLPGLLWARQVLSTRVRKSQL